MIDMQIVDCTFESHAGAILDILNEAIVHSTALYDYAPRTMNSMRQWFDEKAAGHYPIIGVESNGALLGFATYGLFRARPAYKYSIEHSLYVHKDHRGKGLGSQLLKHLVDTATKQSYHLMVGGIDAENQASIRLHERLGFNHAGTVTQAGFKFGRWLDLAFYQLILPTPCHPTDG
jgi:L-amino acid N-acyltransferase